MIGKFILFNGTCLTHISKVTRLKLATYFCKNCGSKISSKINESVFKPVLYCFSKICEKKFNRKLFLDLNLSKFQNFQVIKCSGAEKKKDFKNSITEIEIFMVEQMGKCFLPGVKIRCAGILLPSAYEWVSSYSSSNNFYVQATFIEKLCDKFQDERKFFFMQQYILELIKSPNLYDRISNSLVPCFVEDINLKKCLTLAITNSGAYPRKNSQFFRHQIHILLIGDFNIGKSSFLEMLSDLSPNAEYINSLDNTITTSFKSRSNSHTNLHFSKISGPNLGIGNIIFVDNALFLKERDYFKINEILGDQLSFAKKDSIKTTVVASTTKFEHFEVLKKEGKLSDVKTTFFQKFDLIFIKERKISDIKQQRISDYLLENFGKKDNFSQKKNLIDENILRALFIELEPIHPTFTKMSFEMVIYYYVSLKTRNSEVFNISLNIRHLISIIRLSIALAKLNFRNVISINDTKEASKLLTSSILSMKNFKLSEVKYSDMSNENNIYNLIRKTSLQLKKSILSLSHLSKLSFSMGFSAEDFAKCLETYENLNVWAISLKQMKLVFLL